MTWAQLDENQCPCKGTGWAEVDNGIWKECRIHFEGQIHPDTRTLLLDEPARLAEEERKSRLRFSIEQTRARISELQIQLKEEQSRLLKLDLELVNRTSTVRAMPAVKIIPEPPSALELDTEELNWGDVFAEEKP